MKEYKGIIIRESLEKKDILNNLKVILVEEEKSMGNSNEKWHIYTVKVTREEIKKLQTHLKQGWYMHFWDGKDVVVVYKNKIFGFNFDEKATWEDALEYGRSLGIPDEQLDFPIE